MDRRTRLPKLCNVWMKSAVGRWGGCVCWLSGGSGGVLYISKALSHIPSPLSAPLRCASVCVCAPGRPAIDTQLSTPPIQHLCGGGGVNRRASGDASVDAKTSLRSSSSRLSLVFLRLFCGRAAVVRSRRSLTEQYLKTYTSKHVNPTFLSPFQLFTYQI